MLTYLKFQAFVATDECGLYASSATFNDLVSWQDNTYARSGMTQYDQQTASIADEAPADDAKCPRACISDDEERRHVRRKCEKVAKLLRHEAGGPITEQPALTRNENKMPLLGASSAVNDFNLYPCG
ncbi:hypothetical protein MRX96_057039 [Rhipicephalus microplus]